MAYEAEILASATVGKEGIVQVSTSFLEEYFNISREALRKWEQKGCPKIGRGKWDFIAVIRWHGGLDPLEISDEDSSKNLVTQKLKADIFLKEQQGQLAEIELRRTRGELIEVEDAKQAFGKVITNAKTLFLSLPPKVAPRLLGLSIMDDLRDILDEYKSAFVAAKSGKAVSAVIDSIVEDIGHADSVQEINDLLTRLVREILEELSSVEVGEEDED